MVTFLRTDFKSLSRKPEKITWINLKSEEEEKLELETLPQHFLEDMDELYESLTDEEKEKLKSPTRQQVMHFYNQIQKLCKAVGKLKAMNLLIRYTEKIANSKDIFPRSVLRYARILNEFANKFKKNVFDVRLVQLWLYDKSEFENFISGSLQLIRHEYLFNELALGLI